MPPVIVPSERPGDAGLLALQQWSRPIRNPSVFLFQLQAIHRVTRDWSSHGRWFKTNAVDPYLIDANMRTAYQWFAGYRHQPKPLQIWWHIAGSAALAVDWDFNTKRDTIREETAGHWLRAITYSLSPQSTSAMTIQTWCQLHPWMHDTLVADGLDRNDSTWLNLIQSCQPTLGPRSLNSLVGLMNMMRPTNALHPFHSNLCAEVHPAMESVMLHYPDDTARLRYYLDLFEFMAPAVPGLDWIVQTVLLEREQALRRPCEIELPMLPT